MTEPLKKMDHMVFNVRDLDAAIDFYTRVVGMKVVMHFKERKMAFLSFGERFADIRLFEMGEQYEKDRHWHGFNHVAFQPEGGIEEFNALHQRLKDEGANIEGIESYAEGRHQSLYFYDPEGNRLEFYWESTSWILESREKMAKAYGRAGEQNKEGSPIDLYAAPTSNGVKAAIALEMLEIPYNVIPVSLRGSDKPEGFAEASVTSKIPAISDHATGVNLCESGAILMYLAEKTSSTLMPSHPEKRAKALQWLFIASATFGPASSAGIHYLHFNKGKAPYAEQRATSDLARFYGITEKALSETAYLAGDEITLGDIAFWPLVTNADWQGIDLKEYPHIRDWYLKLAEHKSFKSGYDLMDEGRVPPKN